MATNPPPDDPSPPAPSMSPVPVSPVPVSPVPVSPTSHPHSFTKLQLAVFTWNCANTTPLPSHINQIRSRVINEGIDVLVFGLQENFIKPTNPWSLVEDPIVRILQDAFYGEDLIQVHYSYLLGITQVVYVRSSLVSFYRQITADTVRTGFSGWLGNKGAVCCTFQLGSVTITCVCVHLCSQESNVQRRNEEIQEIWQAYPWLSHSSYAFLYGDLNYRLDVIPFSEALQLMARKETHKMLQCDQLQRQIKTERIPRFREADITFPPSYKLVPNSIDNYANAKLRVPAWCDRILYRTSDRPVAPTSPPIPVRLDPVAYGTLDLPNCSDHKMVYGYFDLYSDWLEFSPPLEFILPDVSWPSDSDLTVRILLSGARERGLAKLQLFSSWDWIALHRFGCLSTSDYCCYVWTPLSSKHSYPNSDRSHSCTLRARGFPRHQEGALYQLYYHTADKEVLAVSHPFCLTRGEEAASLLMPLNS